MIHLSRAKPGDAFQLVLREEDAREVEEGWQELIEGHLDVVAVRDNQDRLVALAGISGIDEKTFSPWLLCSDLAWTYRASLMRCCREAVLRMKRAADEGAFIFNHIPKHSPKNRRFVEALGFRIVPSKDGTWDLFYMPAHV